MQRRPLSQMPITLGMRHTIRHSRIQLACTSYGNVLTNDTGSINLFDMCREFSLTRMIDDITQPNENDAGGTCIDKF